MTLRTQLVSFRGSGLCDPPSLSTYPVTIHAGAEVMKPVMNVDGLLGRPLSLKILAGSLIAGVLAVGSLGIVRASPVLCASSADSRTQNCRAGPWVPTGFGSGGTETLGEVAML